MSDFESTATDSDHNCCEGRGCGFCEYCDGSCRRCAPRYGDVIWPPDDDEKALRRPVCDCVFGAKPLEIVGSRSICAECECYCYMECRCETPKDALPSGHFYHECSSCNGVKYARK